MYHYVSPVLKSTNSGYGRVMLKQWQREEINES